MTFNTIESCFEWLRTSGSYSEAICDAWAASRQSKEELEWFLDSQLFVLEGSEEINDVEKAYRDCLLRVEAMLVENNLIYNV